jgi:hypothetical protein
MGFGRAEHRLRRRIVATRALYDGTILPATSIFIGLGVASSLRSSGRSRTSESTTADERRSDSGTDHSGQPHRANAVTDAAPFEAVGGYSFSDTSGQIVLTTNADALVMDAVNTLSSETYLASMWMVLTTSS